MQADTTPTPTERTDLDLSDTIEAACRGRKEWQVMNADETALCMWFTHDDYTRPAHAAQKWLDEHPSKKAEGYHVVERHRYSELETLALDAAKRLRAQAARQGPALVPLTDEEIERMFFSESAEEIIKFTRALERRYGITGAPNGKPT